MLLLHGKQIRRFWCRWLVVINLGWLVWLSIDVALFKCDQLCGPLFVTCTTTVISAMGPMEIVILVLFILTAWGVPCWHSWRSDVSHCRLTDAQRRTLRMVTPRPCDGVDSIFDYLDADWSLKATAGVSIWILPTSNRYYRLLLHKEMYSTLQKHDVETSHHRTQ